MAHALDGCPARQHAMHAACAGVQASMRVLFRALPVRRVHRCLHARLRPSLRRMCCTWIFTVVSAMSGVRAISLLLAPGRSRAARLPRAATGVKPLGAAAAASAGAIGAGASGAPCDWTAATSLPHQLRADHGLARAAR